MGRRGRRRARQHQALIDERRAPANAAVERRRGRASLEELHRLVEGRQAIDRRVEDVIDQLVVAGVGWVLIGEALGVSRQAARQAFVRRSPSGR
jgi:hypothetical protein